jgi:hypothetical protein
MKTEEGAAPLWLFSICSVICWQVMSVGCCG